MYALDLSALVSRGSLAGSKHEGGGEEWGRKARIAGMIRCFGVFFVYKLGGVTQTFCARDTLDPLGLRDSHNHT